MPTQNSDILRATTINQTIYGGGGADLFYWNPAHGAATFHGGDTNEQYDPNPYFDRSGGDRLIVEGNQGVNIRFTTTEDGTAKSGASVLTFTGMERLYLGAGNDTVNGAKAEILAAHHGTPVHGLTVYGGDGNDSIIGTSTADFIDGGAGNDTMRAGAGDDVIQSSTGDDLIYGGAGNDNIRWGQGNFNEIVGHDTVYGGAGNDLMNVWIKDGWTENGPGVAVQITRIHNDGSFAGASETTIGGGASSLRFFGMEQVWTHEGRDTIDGSGAQISGSGAGFHANTRWGDDRVIGSGGDDTLEGGEGRDTITGGRGDDLISANGDFFSWRAPGDGDRDTLIFRAGDGHDTVLGFDRGIDVLDLGGRSYTVSETDRGTLLTMGQDSILLSNVFDFS